MKKEYNQPLVEVISMDLSGMIATSPGEGSIDPEGEPIDDGGATKDIYDILFDL